MKKFHCQTVLVLTVLLLILLTGLSAGEAEAADPETYLVTIENLTSSQPMSPVVAAASVRGFVMFMTGKKASAEMEALAENGDNAPLLALLGASSKVVDFTSASGPLLPGESVSFELEAKPEDNLSLAAMLICTNDGFTGLDRARFPKGGPVTYKLVAYDARTETNTELSADLPDECALGAPDDNQSPPPERNRAIKKHPGVNGTVGDLTPAHDWTEPVARVTIKRLANTLPLRTAVTVDGVRAHQQALQEIADANGGTRFASSPGYNASADYVANKLREAGYKVEIGNFEFPFFQELADPVLEQVTPNPATYPPNDPAGIFTMEYSGSGDVTALIQPTVDVIVPMPPDAPASTSNSGCEGEFIEDADGNLIPNPTGDNDFEGFIPGNIALVQRGTCFFSTKVVNAQAAGAAGVVIFNEGQPGRIDAFTGTLGGPVATVPAVMANYAIGEELFNLDQAGDVTVHLATSTESETRETVNVLADTRRGDDDHVIVVGAHLDSVTAGPGINDNGSGTAAILEIALQMAELKIRPLNRVRFAFWGAEESGLLGSIDYVSTLPEKELDKIALNLNFDMVGSPNFVRFVYDGDGSAGLSDPGPPGSAEIEQVFLDYFEEQGLQTEPTAFDGRSDYGPFLAFNIPAGGLFSGAEEIKSPEQAAIYGGTAGVAFDPCYHQACDTFDNNSNEVLDQFSDAAAHSVLKFAIEGLQVQTTPLKTASMNMLDYKGPHLRR